MAIHIGEEIRRILREDGHSVTWFANKIHCSRTHVYKIFANENIDVQLLDRIYRVLGHNFYDLLSKNFEEEA